MSGTLLERLQQKVDAELEQYRSGLLSQGAQAVMDSAYELSVKSELAARVDCAFLDRRQLKGLLAQERPLQYVYDRWEPDHAVIGDLLADTVYAAGREADRECITDQKTVTRRMRLTENENEELKDIMVEGFPVLEHTGGDGWTLLHGDTLSIVRAFKPGVFDAVITDPPYASGGTKPSEKNRTTTQKYSSMRADKALPDFDGDQKDQRSWTRWMAEWLSDVRKVCKPGAVLCVFIDWRMAPCLSDAIQWAGWIWRGQVVWDKMTSRPQKGRYRQQSEYMLWASNGPLPIDRPVGCLPGVFRYTNPAKRIHVTEKPLQLMRDIVHICVPGGRILDPFAGAGTTILAAVQEGYEAVGVEVTDAYYRLGGDRVRTALAAGDERTAEASNGEQGIQLDAQKR